MEQSDEEDQCCCAEGEDNVFEDVKIKSSICLHEEEEQVEAIPRPYQVVSRSESNMSSSSEESYYGELALEDLEIIKTIGAGSFGRVVLVQDSNTEEFGALKILSLFDLIQQKQVMHVKSEKNILRKIDHPFITSLKWHYKDEWNIYMLFDYMCGGELFTYLKNFERFSPKICAFYAAEVTCALDYLHSKSIIYRDLKPENLLLDKEGHIKLTDFGFAKEIKDKTYTTCGTPDYMAPETIEQLGSTFAIDWWALGVLVFEMLTGKTPFHSDEYMGKFDKIIGGIFEWPSFPRLETEPKGFVKALLIVDPTSRLGNGTNGVRDIQRHPFFKYFNWNDVASRRITPPIIPQVSFDGDTNNFDVDEFPETWKMRRVSEPEQDLFSDF